MTNPLVEANRELASWLKLKRVRVYEYKDDSLLCVWQRCRYEQHYMDAHPFFAIYDPSDLRILGVEVPNFRSIASSIGRGDLVEKWDQLMNTHEDTNGFVMELVAVALGVDVEELTPSSEESDHLVGLWCLEDGVASMMNLVFPSDEAWPDITHLSDMPNAYTYFLRDGVTEWRPPR